MTDYDEWVAEFEAVRAAHGYQHDMVGSYRDAGMWVPAYHCPGCGRWAHAVRGNDSEHYWMVTDCAKCGRYETRGGPLGWRNNPYIDREVTVRKLEEQ